MTRLCERDSVYKNPVEGRGTLRGRFELPWRERHQLSRLAPYRARLPQRELPERPEAH
jgi:hypothetical protein